MIEFSKYFNDEYQFTLKNVSYTRVEDASANTAGVQVNVQDDLETSVIDNRLEVTFCRSVFFTPEALYKTSVTLGFVLTFRSNLKDNIEEINWAEELISSDNPYLGNVISRASYLIATLTSSYGKQPFVTPPGLVRGSE